MKQFFMILGWVLAMAFGAQAQVFIVERPPHRPHPMPHSWAEVEITSTRVDAKIRDSIATTTVEELIYNPNDQPMEGTFLFPVPKGAQLNKFTMDIDGKPVEAELLKSDKARGIYEDIVRRMKDPALLEYAGRDLFKVHVFPIDPRGKRRLVFSFTEVLKTDSGLVRYAFPLNTEKYSAKPLKNVSVQIDLETARPLKSIYSSSHTVDIRRDGSHRARIGYEASNAKPDSDFELFFMPESSDVGATLMTYRNGDEDGFFLLLASPGVDVKEERIIPKDVVFVLDTSGSMAGNKLSQAKKALQFCIDNLNDEDRFEVIRFSTDVDPLFHELTAVSETSRKRAVDTVKKFKPIGSTAIDAALKAALELQPAKADRPFVVIFLTDGLPTVGETDNDRIIAAAKEKSGGHARVFCIGIGTDVNTHLLDSIAGDTGAQTQYVLPEEDIETKVSNFYAKIKDPVLSRPRLILPESIGASRIHPGHLPDLFKGDQLVVVGRYKTDGKARISLEGVANGKKQTHAFPVRFGDSPNEYDFIPRLWATRRVGWLLDEIRLHGENPETKDEVTQLAREYGIVTPFTSYLIVEDETRRNVPAVARTMPLSDSAGRADSRRVYESFSRSESGAEAIQNSRSSLALKDANTASGGLAGMAAAAPKVMAAPAITAPTASAPGLGAAVTTPSSLQVETLGNSQSSLAQEARYVGGHSFYFNGKQWVDVRVQKLASAKPVRIQFNSKEYYDFLQKNPQASQWFSLGRNLQIVIQNTVYEIYE